MIFKHYREVVRSQDALRYWNIMPAETGNVLEMATRNCAAVPTRERDKITGQLLPRNPAPLPYQKTRAEYAKMFGVGRSTINLWWTQGRPLDDAEAMARLRARKYERTYAEYAKIYGRSRETIGLWMRHRWPLDNVEAVKAFLANKAKIRKGDFMPAAQRAFPVLPMPAQSPAQEARTAAKA